MFGFDSHTLPPPRENMRKVRFVDFLLIRSGPNWWPKGDAERAVWATWDPQGIQFTESNGDRTLHGERALGIAAAAVTKLERVAECDAPGLESAGQSGDCRGRKSAFRAHGISKDFSR